MKQNRYTEQDRYEIARKDSIGFLVYFLFIYIVTVIVSFWLGTKYPQLVEDDAVLKNSTEVVQ